MSKKLWILKRELQLLHFNHFLLAVTLMFISLCVLNTWVNVVQAQQQISQYVETRDRYIQEGEDYWSELQKPLEIIEQKNSNGTITIEANNPIKYELKKTIDRLSLISKNNYPSTLLEVLTFLFGPILFPIIGYYYGNYEYRHGTVKIKAIQANWAHILFAKCQILFIFAATLVITISLLAVLSGNIIVTSIMPHNFPIQDKNLLMLGIESVGKPELLMQMILSIFLISTYMIIGFTVAIVSKKLWYPVLALLIYNLFIPVLGAYDFKNLVSVMGHKVFEFKGFFKLFDPVGNVGFVNSIGIIGVVLVACILTVCVVAKKQSKFVTH